MPAPSPDRVDVELLAAEGASIERRYELTELPRLTELLATGEGEAIARFRFAQVADGVIGCELALEAVVTLECQRCLEPYQQALSSTARLAFVAGEEEADAALAPEDYEAVPLEGDRVDLRALVEDELLLSLPIVAMHGGGTRCAETARRAEADTRDEQEAKTHRPFAQLQDLLKH
jgi:uncharacterized protein